MATKNMKAPVDDASAKIDFAKNTYAAEITTNHGAIRVQFFPDVAPGHVKNFVSLAQLGYYNGLNFHRIIKGFMIQGGCPEGSGSGGPGYTIRAEFNKTPHEAGVLSMARTSDPHSAGSQFFICLGRHTHLDNNYTAFGKTADAESLATVRKIGEVPIGGNDKPREKVVIESVTITVTPK